MDYRKRRYAKRKKKDSNKALLRQIPSDFTELYPRARQRRRKFILHIGPTNSGKTYCAMQALREAGSGIYLSPLRLLAFEQSEALNEDGFPCSLVTGEEQLLVEGAAFQSSTVEMLDFDRDYRCVVLDEAQMISDPERGGHWTAAILGACADEIHVCAAPYAKNILVRLIRECGDTFRIVRHERSVPLVAEEESFSFPESVRPRDALIVFSKKSVHAVAAELQGRGVNCSVIYGALPYDVRQNEARKFIEGENPVVIATDAIGMGLNLPIRRVVFLETDKFDGTDVRPLFPHEIQQIAGRAGRMGMYETGLVTACTDEGREAVAEGLSARVPMIDHAVISFPRTLLDVHKSLSSILFSWNMMTVAPGFQRADMKHEMYLCARMEPYVKDKQLLFRLISIPFDEREQSLYQLWSALAEAELDHSFPDREDLLAAAYLPEELPGDLRGLEETYRKYDLLYTFMTQFGHLSAIGEVMEQKRNISASVMDLLSRQQLSGKTCRLCGRKLSWNYRYGICPRCRENRRNWRRR